MRWAEGRRSVLRLAWCRPWAEPAAGCDGGELRRAWIETLVHPPRLSGNAFGSGDREWRMRENRWWEGAMTVPYIAIVVVGVLLVIGVAIAYTNTRATKQHALSPVGSSETQFVARPPGGKVEIIPNRLYAVVSSGDVETTVDGTVSCWNYVSDGLRSVGQKEIWVTIKRAPGEIEPPPWLRNSIW